MTFVTNNVGDGRVDGGRWWRATTWATMLAMEDAGGEGPYGPAVASAAIRDCHVPQPAGTHPCHQFQRVGAKTTTWVTPGRENRCDLSEGQESWGRRHAEWRKIDVIDIRENR